MVDYMRADNVLNKTGLLSSYILDLISVGMRILRCKQSVHPLCIDMSEIVSLWCADYVSAIYRSWKRRGVWYGNARLYVKS